MIWIVLLALLAGIVGSCMPEVYRDWAFVREARRLNEGRALQETAARLQKENEDLRQQRATPETAPTVKP
jgi:hypothetical protein